MARFSDVQLIQIVIKAARRINRELCLFNTTDEIVINTSTGEFTTPDDEGLEDLVLMQSECLLAQRDYQVSLSTGADGTLIVDGEQKTDTRGRSVARGTFFDSLNSPCSEIKEQIKIEKLRRGCGRLVW